MRSQTVKVRFQANTIVLLMLLVLSLPNFVYAQFVLNPAEYTVYGLSNSMLNDTIKSEMQSQSATAVLQNTMSAQFTMIKGWQNKYNSYLIDVSGFASQIKAGCQLYHDGVRCLMNLYQVIDATNDNPGGVLASLNLNTLYLETTLELITVYNLLNNAIAKGGKANMLNGSERAAILWELSDKMSSLNKKLTQLERSIRIYTLSDLWQNATAGIIDVDKAEIANRAYSRWTRASNITR